MKIVILDNYAANPGDIPLDRFQSIGKLAVYDRTPPENTIERSKGAQAVLTNKVILSESIINALPDLKYIGILATGTNVVDIKAAAKRGIVVTNVPAYSTESVAQHTFAHIINLTNSVAQHDESVAKGDWSNSKDFCYWKFPLTELAGLTLGIVGLGDIGKAVARIGSAFKMRIIVYNKNRPEQCPAEAQCVDLDVLFSESDIVSLHCPLNDGTRHLVNSQRLRKMKPTALLINAGRGPLVDQAALANALNSRTIAGAGLDVLGNEPPERDNPLFKARNCHITPHIAWATLDARKRLMDTAAGNLKAFIDGHPVNALV